MKWNIKIPEPELTTKDGWVLRYAWYPVRLSNRNHSQLLDQRVWFEWVECYTETRHHWGGSDTYVYYREIQHDSPWAKQHEADF